MEKSYRGAVHVPSERSDWALYNSSNFFEPQFPNFSILMDSYSLRTLGINFQVWIFVFLMIAIESLERRMQSDRFYALAAIFLVWITATFMSGTSYLFYYMRL